MLCAWWWLETMRRPRLRNSPINSPAMSRLAAEVIEFHSTSSLSHMAKPSWCIATGPAYFAPALAISSAHPLGSNFGIEKRSK